MDLVTGLIDEAERHGFDQFRLWGATERASIAALTALTANDLAGLSSEHHDPGRAA